MSKLKIRPLGLYSIVFGILIGFNVGCGKTGNEYCKQWDNKPTECEGKETSDTICTYDTANKKCIAKAKAIHQEIEEKGCVELGAEACKKSKDCDFSHNKCTDAKTKGICANIQEAKACNDDPLCTIDPTTKLCTDKKDKTITPPPPSPAKKKSVALFSIMQPASKCGMNNNTIEKMAISGNGQWVYFSSKTKAKNNHLNIFNMESPEKMAKNMMDRSKWTHNDTLETGLDDKSVAQAKLEGNNMIIDMRATQKGAVVSMAGSEKNMGVAYLEGDTFKAAWKNHERDMKGGMPGEVHGMVMAKSSGEEFMTVYSVVEGEVKKVLTSAINLNRKKAPVGMLDLEMTRKKNGFKSMLINKGGFLVDAEGIMMLNDKVGMKHEMPELESTEVDFGSGTWSIHGVNPATFPNIAVSAVAEANGMLYIALRKDGKHTGGVAMFNSKGPFTKQCRGVDPAWHNISVLDLTVDADKAVWAVTADQVMKLGDKAKPEGTVMSKKFMMENQYSQDADKGTDKNMRFMGDMDCCDDMTGAQWVGPHMIITTANNGVFFMIHQAAEVMEATTTAMPAPAATPPMNPAANAGDSPKPEMPETTTTNPADSTEPDSTEPTTADSPADSPADDAADSE
jgi:hypothetical protein